jgi:tRNA-splicing ligase RtcB
MKKHDLEKIGVPNSCLDLGVEYCSAAARGGLFRRYKPAELIGFILDNPQEYFNDSVASRFAKALAADAAMPVDRGPAPYKVWGEDQIDLNAIEQIRSACNLPVSARGALMPDAHMGYGLPIGGVLATVGAVIPYAVGVDIACRMKLTVLDIDPLELERAREKYEQALLTQTAFGKGCHWTTKRQHAVMDEDWKVSLLTKQLKDMAWSQLGTSGGGNHFVEFGKVVFSDSDKVGDVVVGKPYVAVLSHSGSRGPGSKVCSHYHSIAQKRLPKKFSWAKGLAWLDMATQEGQEYWEAMNLMGRFAAANHDVIHQKICQYLGQSPVLQIENHHNFAWKEVHDGVEMIVHRKGATPAGEGVLGVIPGSMASPAYVVKGNGVADSLRSASHGAGRKMARTAAKAKMSWDYWRGEIKQRGVTLLSAGIDEVPGVYKDIDSVMQRQSDLVSVVARFDPKIVRMADDGFAED